MAKFQMDEGMTSNEDQSIKVYLIEFEIDARAQ